MGGEGSRRDGRWPAQGTHVTLTDPEVHEVCVSAPGLASGAEFALTPVGQKEEIVWGPFGAVKDELHDEGRCSLSYVPTGMYTLTIEGEAGSMRVSVPCG